jgi:hypothetical protein
MNVKPDVHSMNVRKWPKSIIYFGVGTRRSPESDQRLRLPSDRLARHLAAALTDGRRTNSTKQSIIKADIFQRPTAFIR